MGGTRREGGRPLTPDRPPATDQALFRARAHVRDAESILVLTGAGVSADSGVPTFRGPGGLWKQRRPEELATPEAFSRDPRLVWEWYAWRQERIRACVPNAAHLALARLAWGHGRARIVTQNIDGLHADAAATLPVSGARGNAMPLELHGSIFRVRCTSCASRTARREPIDATSVESLPTCPSCGELLRPDVVWFGEPLEPAALTEAFELAAAADVCLVVGTSAVVHPAARLATTTRAAGGHVIEVNREETPITSIASISLRGSAVEVVPGVVSERRTANSE